jgi:hypothetical protein
VKLNQLKAMAVVGLIALLAMPAYVLLGVFTIPLGIGILMVTNSSPWLLNLYPFLFAASGHWTAPVYHLDHAVSVPLTIVQWALIAWAGSFYLRRLSGGRLLLGVCLLFAAVGVASSIILSLLQVKLMWTAAHM